MTKDSSASDLNVAVQQQDETAGPRFLGGSNLLPKPSGASEVNEQMAVQQQEETAGPSSLGGFNVPEPKPVSYTHLTLPTNREV